MQIAYNLSTTNIFAVGSAVSIGTDAIKSVGGDFERTLPFSAFATAYKPADFAIASVAGLTGPFSPDVSHQFVNGQVIATAWAPTPMPLPGNTPGNPYFGKRPLLTKDFYALVGQVLAPDRVKRLIADSHFLWVGKVIDHVDVVDPDDKSGQFLQLIHYLTTTKGDDGALLTELAEAAAIMQAWPTA